MFIHRKPFRTLAVMLAIMVAVSMAPVGGMYAFADETTGADVTAEADGTNGDGETAGAGNENPGNEEEGDPVQELDKDVTPGEDPNVITEPTEPTVPARTDIVYTGAWPTLPGGQEAIAQTAINLAWPYGTPKATYSYNTGSATAAFQLALDTVYPNRSSWGKKPKVGASCDVFTETCVRYSGYDTKVPRGYTDAESYYPSHPEKWTYTGVYKVEDMQPGDVILWRKASGTVHACIFVRINGTGYLAEAHYISEY